MLGADVMVVSAGVQREPVLSRSEVPDTNVKVIDGTVDVIMQYATVARPAVSPPSCWMVTAMIEAISHGRNCLLPCVVLLEGEFGEHDVACLA